MKASEIRHSDEYAQGVIWEVDTIEHVIRMNASEGDYDDVYWQVDQPVVTDVLSALYKDGWQAEIVHRPTVSATIVVHVAYSVMSC